jgi:glycosyltransferase involved in cell wall biosynthesis
MSLKESENIKIIFTDKVLKRNNLELFLYSLIIFFFQKKKKVLNVYVSYNFYLYIKKFVDKSFIDSLIKINIFLLDYTYDVKFNSIINDEFIHNKYKIYDLSFSDFLINYKLPRINVIVPNLNHGHYILRTFKSIHSQNYPNYRVYFLDSKSTDSSSIIINKIKKKYSNIYFFSRKDQNLFEGLNYVFRNKIFKFDLNDIISVLPNSDLYLNASLFFVGYKFLDSSIGSLGAKAMYINNKQANNYSSLPLATLKKEFYHNFQNIHKLEFLPASQFFFFKFKYLSDSNFFKISGCHTNSFILIILNVIKNKKKALSFMTKAAAYVLHFDHSKNFFQSRDKYIVRSRIHLVNEIKKKKLLNNFFLKNILKSFSEEEQLRKFSNLFELFRDFFKLRINLIKFILIFIRILIDKSTYLVRKYF